MSLWKSWMKTSRQTDSTADSFMCLPEFSFQLFWTALQFAQRSVFKITLPWLMFFSLMSTMFVTGSVFSYHKWWGRQYWVFPFYFVKKKKKKKKKEKRKTCFYCLIILFILMCFLAFVLLLICIWFILLSTVFYGVRIFHLLISLW